jgi:hypothetical protein
LQRDLLHTDSVHIGEPLTTSPRDLQRGFKAARVDLSILLSLLSPTTKEHHMRTTTRTIDTTKRARSVVMKRMKAKVAVMAITAVVAGGVMATPAFAAAGPNDGGTNCHGVWLSYLSTSDMAPGQLQKDYGISVQQVQAIADVVCEP